MERKPTFELHCAQCGGFISGQRYVSYRPASPAAAVAPPTLGLCGCVPPIIFGPPPGFLSTPGIAIPKRPSA